jgi:uncharacterized protein YndB with AHSA1/START domain
MTAAVKKKVLILAPIEKVWAALTRPKAITGWMGGLVKSNPRVGGRFALFGGETTGKYTLVEKPAKLEATWRQANWPPEWPDSRVRWSLKATRAGTSVALVHDRFPDEQEREGHDEGWDVYWLEPMKAWLESKPNP